MPNVCTRDQLTTERRLRTEARRPNQEKRLKQLNITTGDMNSARAALKRIHLHNRQQPWEVTAIIDLINIIKIWEDLRYNMYLTG